jgi:hypothetical protein
MQRVLILLAVCACSARALYSQAGSTCRTSDAGAARVLSYVTELVTSADSERVKVRNGLRLPATDASKVGLVSDNRVCDKIAQSLNAATGTSGLTRQLYVVKVGSYYAAQDPDHPSGEWAPTVSLDKLYHVLGVVLGP